MDAVRFAVAVVALVLVACGGTAGTAMTDPRPSDDDERPTSPTIGAVASVETQVSSEMASKGRKLEFADKPLVLFSRDPELTGGTPLFNLVVRTTRPLPKAGSISVKADLTVNGIGDPAPVTRLGDDYPRCYGLMVEGGNPETEDVKSGDKVRVELAVRSKPAKRLRARVAAIEVSAADLGDESGLPARRYLRKVGCG